MVLVINATAVLSIGSKADLEPDYWRRLETDKVAPGIRNLPLVQYVLGPESPEMLFGEPSGRKFSG